MTRASDDPRLRQNARGMGWVSAQHVLSLPVRVRGIQLGRPVDLVFDRAVRRVLGFEVRCGDDERRFLPLAVVKVRARELEVGSPLLLLGETQLAFYTSAGCTFRTMRGAHVVERGTLLGELEDVTFDARGEISSVLVLTPSGPEPVAYDADVELELPRPGVRAAS